ncbi:hypothetical protein ACQY0O_000081 [Thecaphora frezii]
MLISSILFPLSLHSGYTTFRRRIDLTRFGHLYLQIRRDEEDFEADPPFYRRIVCLSAPDASGPNVVNLPLDNAPCMYWYRSIPAHRYTSVALISTLPPGSDANASEAWVAATLKLSHLLPDFQQVERHILSVLDQPRRSLDRGTGTDRAKRCASILPKLIDHGLLYLSTEEAGVAAPQQPSWGATCDRRPNRSPLPDGMTFRRRLVDFGESFVQLDGATDPTFEAELRRKLQTLQVDDDIEGGLLVLAYEMLSRFDLAEYRRNGARKPYVAKWSRSSAQERFYRFGCHERRLVVSRA